MDSDQTLKILKMVQEGFLTPEQGQRLIQELAQSEQQKQESPKSEPVPDVFQVFNEVGNSLRDGFGKLFQQAEQTFRSTPPQNIVIKVKDNLGNERNRITIPYQVFQTLKPLMSLRGPALPGLPLDFQALFSMLESGQTGKIFEYQRPDSEEIFEVWLE